MAGRAAARTGEAVIPAPEAMVSAPEAVVSVPAADLESDSLLGTFPEGRRLVGTRCGQCGQVMIGTRTVCSSCVSRDVSRVPLPVTGVLYSFTRLHGLSGKDSLSGKHGGSEGVRQVGYVDLDLPADHGGVRTLADIRAGGTPLRPDMRVELGTDGDDWFFAPAMGE
jgi:uncharacterized protein